MDTSSMTSAPGYIYGLGFCIAAVLLCLAKPARGTLFRRITIWILLTPFCAVAAHVTDYRKPIFFIPSLLFALLFPLLILLATCEMNFLAALYYLSFVFILGEFLTALTWQIFLYLVSINVIHEDIRWCIVCLVCVAAVALASTFFERFFYRKEHQSSAPETKDVVLSLFAAISIYLFSNISNVYRNTPFSGQTPMEINLIRMLVDAGGVILLSALHVIREQENTKAEIAIMQNLMEAQYRNYQTSERSMNLIHEKYHDLKHQITLLRSEMPDAKRQGYLDRMEDELRSFEVGANTGNHIVDTILMDKAIQCSQKAIKLNCAADGRLLSFMDPLDLSSLLGNLLDNAIEHVERIPDPAKRWIEFVIRKKNGFVVVGVGNCFEGEVVFQDGLPKTTKSDERFHGYGTKSIKDTVARYDGSVNFSAENGLFLVKMSFSLPET